MKGTRHTEHFDFFTSALWFEGNDNNFAGRPISRILERVASVLSNGCFEPGFVFRDVADTQDGAHHAFAKLIKEEVFQSAVMMQDDGH